MAINSHYKPVRAIPLSHKEWVSTDNGCEYVDISDCRYFCDPEDFDLEVQQRSGENLKEVSTILQNGSVNIKYNMKETEKKENENE